MNIESPSVDPDTAPPASISSDIACETGFSSLFSQEKAVLQREEAVMCEVSSIAEETEGKAVAVTVTAVSSQNVTVNGSDEVPSGRRASARLKNRPEKEKTSDGPQNAARNVGKKVSKKRARAEERVGLEVPSVNVSSCETVKPDDSPQGDSVAVHVNASGSESSNTEETSAHSRVQNTIRIFNTHYLHFVQEEEKRCKKAESDDWKISKLSSKRNKSSKTVAVDVKTCEASKFKGGSECGEDIKRSSKRPDLKAITKMKETKTILYPKGRIGHLPGIDVGRQFFSRCEMVAVGLHSHWLGGIDYLGESYRKLAEFRSYTFPIAISIVMSGQYEDDLDNSEDIVYTGQGGNNLLGNKRQIQDQEMLRGNLALKNNMDQGVPVRVTRGHTLTNSYSGKLYTYDGLYKVVQYWVEKGVSGFIVFKYKLSRLKGQPDLTTNQVLFTRAQVPKSFAELRGLVSEDISGGQEGIPIPATNMVDDPPVPPTGFMYSKSLQVPESIKLPPDVAGCNCKGTCVDPKACTCARLNGTDFPYVRKDGGRLIEAKSVVFECGPNCGCGADCVNRTSQHGLKYRLEVFRTPKKGWAVRSWDAIPSGAPICEYTGILKRTDELDNVGDNNFIFDIDCLETMNGLDGRERRLGDISIHTKFHLDKTGEKRSESVPEFCIDAGSIGNIARFINHSCQPNLFVQCVLSSHHDIKLARVMLFAADFIPPLQELTYDYGYALDSVVGLDGKIKQMECYCGASDCRKRLY